MLYDVLPPLLLFVSFGGIIVVVSRVVMRMRNQQFSEEIQAEVDSTKPIHEESLLGPRQAGVMLMGNRLKYMAMSTKSGVVGAFGAAGRAVTSIRARRLERKQERQDVATVSEQSSAVGEVQMPETGLRDRIAVLAQRGKEGLSSLQQEIANRVPDPKAVGERFASVKNRVTTRRQVVQQEEEPAPKSSPVIRLVRHNPAEEQPKEEKQKQGIMSQILKREKEVGAIAQAEAAIAKKDFDAAEDALIPYIMKHAGDTKAYMLLGKSAIGKEAWDEAMEIFQQAIKLDDTLVDAYANLGHAALNAGKFTLAIQSLQHARDMDANNVQIREELLFIARRMDNKVVEKGVLEELALLKEQA